MDLVSFTDFVLAWDHRSHPAAIKYFFPIFDLQRQVRAGCGVGGPNHHHVRTIFDLQRKVACTRALARGRYRGFDLNL